ncbi:MAG: hypothetical protein V4564_17160 [Pseudomonadota bacterium]|uniref:hypothetical protein n=1 Tax=Sphingomonas sp. ERG5 TaxID=1381597 RepID=UPI000A929F72|nr:hypothetical protein [Sphingomonas sp. ERG5]
MGSADRLRALSPSLRDTTPPFVSSDVEKQAADVAPDFLTLPDATDRGWDARKGMKAF